MNPKPIEPLTGKNNLRGTSWQADETFLSKRVSLGDTWVVDLKGSSTAEKVCMRIFQGMVNRDVAQLYLINSDHKEFGASEKFWIEEYQRQGWVNIVGYLTIDAALAQFRTEFAGYVRATESEPWSIHAAAVHAMRENGIVAPDDVAAHLRASGWVELDDMCGHWPDAVSAFNAMVTAHRDDLAYPGMALVQPSENLWDFIMQQQIMPMFSRPKHETWDGVAKIMDTYPANYILYGYVSDDTVEEEIAVERASSSGKYLVPTHQVSNLSFHSAVLGNSPIKAVEQARPTPIPPLDPAQVNIAIAITDGDNLQVPIMQYPLPEFWNTDKTHSIPLGWSMGVSLSTLAPGIWEYYRKTVHPNDEIVSIMGIAYVHASTLPEPVRYFEATFSSMADMGLSTLWSLDSSLTITDEPLWDILESAPSRDALKGVVVGYGPSIDKVFRRDTGTPVMITQNGYDENAARLKARIEDLMALDAAERSPVNFIMATNWSTNARDLYKTLKPLEDQGVRFLTPSQALALMPDIQGIARSSIDTVALPGTCLPVGGIEQFGSTILSSPTLAEINNPIPMPLNVSVDAPKPASSGNAAAYSRAVQLTATIDININEMAQNFLQYRVLPVVEGYGLSDEFSQYAWMKFESSSICIGLTLFDQAASGHVTNITSTGNQVSAEFIGSRLNIYIDGFTSDSRVTVPPIKISVTFIVDSAVEPSLSHLKIKPEAVAFDYTLTIGIGEEDGPLVGGVRGKMAGTGAADLL
jgi:hypothetical protein